MNISLLGGIIGCLIGIVCGLAGTYLAVESAIGPRERSFMIRAACVCWGAVTVFLASMVLVPTHWPFFWIPSAFLLAPAIRYWNARQVEIRQWEQAQTAVEADPGRQSSPM
jgi:hypothetical protein